MIRVGNRDSNLHLLNSNPPSASFCNSLATGHLSRLCIHFSTMYVGLASISVAVAAVNVVRVQREQSSQA